MSYLRDCTALLAILLCTAPGCKRQKNEAPGNSATPAQSPIANPPPKLDDQPTGRSTPRRSGGSDWRDSERKAGAKAPGKARVVKAARTDSGASGTDASKKDELDAEARAKTLKAVDGALKGATASMKRCYDQHGVGTTSTSISFKVHRSGYFMAPNVRGVSAKVQRCIGKVLTGLRVQGVKGSMTVTRTIRFKKWR